MKSASLHTVWAENLSSGRGSRLGSLFYKALIFFFFFFFFWKKDAFKSAWVMDLQHVLHGLTTKMSIRHERESRAIVKDFRMVKKAR